VNASGKESAPFYFRDNTPHECLKVGPTREAPRIDAHQSVAREHQALGCQVGAIALGDQRGDLRREPFSGLAPYFARQ
jgi:hypothetical protein